MSLSGETQKYELYSNQLAFLLFKYKYVYTLRESLFSVVSRIRVGNQRIRKIMLFGAYSLASMLA